MCMGFGCNAVGVTGCRIIESKRERLIAMLTNALIPCNGRFPTLIALITMFFVFGSGVLASAMSTVILCGFILFCILVTFLMSSFLSATILKGKPSAFMLELPPYRRPQIGRVIIRSILDRTVHILGRAAAVAAPAGLVLWLLGSIQIGDSTLLVVIAETLDGVGYVFGMDGAILLAFLLSFPANEIMIPILLMIYSSGAVLTSYSSLASLQTILMEHQWTWVTALCVAVFLLFHWPCSTTLWSIQKESGKIRYTLLAALLPTVVGLTLCALIHGISLLFF